MSITYTNFKGHTYYLHHGKTKAGKPSYHFSKTEPETPVETLPEGYEIFENARGQVFCRRIKPQVIRADELQTVERAVAGLANVKFYRLYVEGNQIVIYMADDDADPTARRLASLGGGEVDRDYIRRHLSFSAMMRFVLVDEQARLFRPQRYNFRGSVDDWVHIGQPDRLKQVVREYVRHLGEESFYELWEFWDSD